MDVAVGYEEYTPKIGELAKPRFSCPTKDFCHLAEYIPHPSKVRHRLRKAIQTFQCMLSLCTLLILYYLTLIEWYYYR